MLGNSCASYVQFRAGPAIIDKTAEVGPSSLAQDVRFIREHDEFVLEQDAPSQANQRKMYLPSEKKMGEFRQTLKRFNETLTKKKVFSRLGISARDPADFDIEYVLSIAARLSEQNHQSDNITACRRFARQLCHKAVKHRSMLSGLISLAPTDAYGSLVSGGFTIVLAALEAHENLRSEMEQCLAQIPKELKRIRTLSDVYIQRDELHKCADDVLVSIFTVLERIIEKFSRTWKENISLKFMDSRGNVKDALHMLSESITEFNREAEVCAHLRMGRLEETGQTIKSTVESTRDLVGGTSTKVNELGYLVKDILDRQNIETDDRRNLVGAVNRLYSFLASNPVFNAVDGTVDRNYLRSTKAKDEHDRSTRLVERWLKSLGDFDPSPEGDIKKMIEHSEKLTLKEQDKVEYIMGCQPFQDWLGKPRSSALCVRAETAPEDIVNFISVNTAMLALTLRGALGVLKSLNGQLLKIMLERQLLAKPPFDQNDKIWRKSTEDSKYSCNLLEKLMALLPVGSVVFVLLDSVSRASGDKSMVDDLAERILRISRQSPGIVVKLLITDPVPSSHFRRIADFSLHVPDDVDGWQCGMNVESMKRKNALKLRDLEELQEGV